MDKRIFKKCPTLGEYHGMALPYVKSQAEYREFYNQHKEMDHVNCRDIIENQQPAATLTKFLSAKETVDIIDVEINKKRRKIFFTGLRLMGHKASTFNSYTAYYIFSRILKSKKRTFVHKSIEKTQKFKYFWVFSGMKCARQSTIQSATRTQRLSNLECA